MQSKLLCTAQFVRSSGLGNRLFPWARCKIFSHCHQIPMLAPSWAHLRSGPLRKGGTDLRNYFRKILLWDVFHKEKQEIGGIHKFFLQNMLQTANEPISFDNSGLLKLPDEKKLIVFQGDADHFLRLYPWRSFIYQQLKKITKSKWLQQQESYKEIPIAMNVRRGKDFPEVVLDKVATGPVRVPLEWFIEALQIVRKIIGYPAKAYLISDGTADDLMPLIRQPHVEWVQSSSPIVDLLVLAKAKMLIGSGGSSFSAWASFLGQMPTITYPGQSLAWFKLKSDQQQYVDEFNISQPSETLKEHLRRQFQ